MSPPPARRSSSLHGARGRGILVGLGAVLCCVPAASTLASRPRLHLEWVDSGRCAETGEIDAFATAVELEGAIHPIGGSAWRLALDGETLAGGSVKETSFLRTGSPLSVGVVVQTSHVMTEDLPAIKEGVLGLLRALPPRARVGVIAYGAEVKRLSSGSTPSAAATRLRGIEGE